MPLIQAFPSCCGASIITSFSGDPDAGVTFETEIKEGRWGPMEVPKLDKDGKPVVKQTYAQQFAEKIGAHKPTGDHAYFGVLNKRQMKTSWPKILKEAGFVYVGQWNNTVHGVSPNYLFVLPKHNSPHEVPDFHTVPEEWAALSKG